MSYIENKIVNFFVIFILVFLIMFVMLFYFNYQPYIQVYGESKKEYVDIYLTDPEIANLNHSLKYKDEIMDYEIVEIGEDYIIQGNEIKRNLKIDFDFDQNDYILELYLGVGEETNIWEYFYQKYMKGAI